MSQGRGPRWLEESPWWAWLDQRLGLGAWLARETARQIPAVTAWPQLFWRCLGGLSLLLFLAQALTGLALLPWYRPSPGEALTSLASLEQALPAGWLVRRLHAAGGHLMLILVGLHWLRVLWRGAYANPRELHWLSGFVLFVCTLVMLVSGGILPYSRAGLDLAAAILGPGSGPPALAWALALHLGLPVIMPLLLWAHLALVRKTGVSGPL